ncbi:glycosyltransferase family 2 [Zalerion maritima]|uniref:Glycosyltransferase family 2 n=1 Tax=Zalerion maritima TaxID=339359 RepID=A0AAD5WSZ7_9PEZI|nr:glycosyltransferase family 2 [Zalerion maritima]
MTFLLGIAVTEILSFLRSSNFWLCVFCFFWLHRYVRLIVHCISHWSYKSVPLPLKPTYDSKHVTVIIPTIHNAFEELRPSLLSILACDPYELILVTTAEKQENLKEVVKTLGYPNIRVLYTGMANKRLQVCAALPTVKTRITVMADDDVTWQPAMLPWLLAPFEDKKMGGVGTCQRVKRVFNDSWEARIFNWLGAAYIERRNFEISATHNIDGGTSCMSGRTGAYRSEILNNGEFLQNFQTERWGKYTMNADDDNFVTRWLVNHQWKTWVHALDGLDPTGEATGLVWFGNVISTGKFCPFIFSRCIHPQRQPVADPASTTTSQQPWCSYALHLATFTSLAFLTDPMFLASLWWVSADWDPTLRRRVWWSQFIFMFAFTKVVKLVGLFRKNPHDIMYLPISIVFGYIHGFIKLYALFTLNMTSWGSRADADTNDDLRMTPRPKRSPSITTPPGRDLIRYREKQSHSQPEDSFRTADEKQPLFYSTSGRHSQPLPG